MVLSVCLQRELAELFNTSDKAGESEEIIDV